MSKNIDFQYKIFSEELIDDLVYLFELDGKKISREYLLKKYLYSLNHKETNYLGCISYDDFGKPASFVGGMPCLIKGEKSNYKSVQIGDVITSPLHRGKGLFVSTAMHFFSHLRDNTKYELLFAFPNEKSAPGFFNKMGWHKGDNFQLLNYSIKMFNFYGLFHKFSFLTPLYNWYKFFILRFLLIYKNGFNVLLNKDFHLMKDFDFFDYKKRYSDSSFIKLFGNFYFIKFLDGIQIDITNINNIKELKRDLRILSILFGVDKFTTFLSSNSKIKEDLISCGFCIQSKIEWNTGYLFLHNAERTQEFFFSIADTDEF